MTGVILDEAVPAQGQLVTVRNRQWITAEVVRGERWEQPSLFELDEGQRRQLRADHEALRARRDAIPAQREVEIAALRRRYAEPTTRWFPVAVTLLVPAPIAHRAAHRAAQGTAR